MYGPYVSDTTCGPGYFKCMKSEGCIPMKRVCDGHFDCLDHTDEVGCTGHGKMLLYVTGHGKMLLYVTGHGKMLLYVTNHGKMLLYVTLAVVYFLT